MSTRIQLLSGLVCVAMAAAFSTTLQAADLEAGRKTFEQVCAACHGPAGRPDPNDPVVKALDPQPADLSDPLFNSREPADDWQIVVTHGGPALGLSAVMPAQAGALKADEIANVVAYAKTLAPGSAEYPPGEMNFFLPVRTKKAFPEDEIVLKGRLADVEEGDNTWRTVLEIEKRFGKRSMGVLEVVYEDDGTDGEVTMVEAGAKTVLHWDLERRSILSGALIYALATEDGASDEVIPYLAYGKQLTERSTFQSSARVIVPVDAGDGDSVKWTALPQVRVGLTRGGHVALNAGVEFPLSDQSYETRYHLTLLWDFADGSFFKGW